MREPLLVNLTDTWALRPDAATGIPNLFLASDYVRTYTDLATMEGANEAARRAVNGLLDAVNFDGSRCELWPLHEPEFLAALAIVRRSAIQGWPAMGQLPHAGRSPRRCEARRRCSNARARCLSTPRRSSNAVAKALDSATAPCRTCAN